ncbi:MAG: hypothetical protein M1827_002216 [Pycnora praestabilis]|nr:MAG: hypothetical protein M1827_002216 [Pycnora praestabilis]
MLSTYDSSSDDVMSEDMSEETTQGEAFADPTDIGQATSFPAGPLPQSKTPYEAAEPYPAHEFGSAYLPSILESWPPSERWKYCYLNSSFFSHPSGGAPTLFQLKQHAHALANLFKTLEVIDHEVAGQNAFDWLEDLDKPYTNNDPTHHMPLRALVNRFASTTDEASGALSRTQGCPLSHDPDCEPHVRYIEHANELLEFLDDMYSADGGILALMPAQEEQNPESAPFLGLRSQIKDTILGQWLQYTTSLVTHVAELELEVTNARDVLAGEATVPLKLNRDGRMAEGRPLLFPQDRYVLANLTPELWEVLNERLAVKEQAMLRRERSARSALHEPPVTESAHQASGMGMKKRDPMKPLAWIDVPSRLYRVAGSPTIFMTPAHGGIHPSTHTTLALESQPLVQTVIRPHPPTDSAHRTALHRSLRRKISGLQEENRQLKETIIGIGEDVVAFRDEIRSLRMELGKKEEQGEVERRIDLKLAVLDKAAEREKIRLAVEARRGDLGGVRR